MKSSTENDLNFLRPHYQFLDSPANKRLITVKLNDVMPRHIKKKLLSQSKFEEVSGFESKQYQGKSMLNS